MIINLKVILTIKLYNAKTILNLPSAIHESDKTTKHVLNNLLLQPLLCYSFV